MVMENQLKIATALRGITYLTLIMKISSAENTDILFSTLQTNQTIIIPTSGEEMGSCDYTIPYFKITVPSNPCTYKTLLDVQTGIRKLQKDLSRLWERIEPVEKRRWIVQDSNYRHMFPKFVLKLQTIELELKIKCPKNSFITQKTTQSMAKDLQPGPYDGIVLDIITGQFSSADEQLQLTSDNYAVYENFAEKVKHYEYLNNSGVSGRYQLLSFGSFISNPERKLKLYDALNSVIISDDNAYRLVVQLHHNVMTEIVEIPGFIGTGGIELICKLWREHRNEAINVLYRSLMVGWAKEVENDIREFCPNVLYNVTKDIIVKGYEETNMLTVLHRIDPHTYGIQERVICYESLINKLKDEEFDHEFLMLLVQRIKMTWDDPELNTVHAYWRKRYKNAINELPSSLRNIVLYSPICIKNSHYGEYLYAGDPEFTDITDSDEKYHQVFSGISNDVNKSAEFKWRIRFKGDRKIEFDNVQYNTKLSAAHCIAGTCRSILESDIPSNRFQGWRVRVSGKEMELDLNGRQNYLYVNERKLDNNTRIVFVSRSRRASNSEYRATWEFVDCSDSSIL